MKQVDRFLVTRGFNFDISKNAKPLIIDMESFKDMLVAYHNWKERKHRWKRLKK